MGAAGPVPAWIGMADALGEVSRARTMAALFRSLSECTKPVVAAVHGYAIGMAKPVSVKVDTFGTGDERAAAAAEKRGWEMSKAREKEGDETLAKNGITVSEANPELKAKSGQDIIDALFQDAPDEEVLKMIPGLEDAEFVRALCERDAERFQSPSKAISPNGSLLPRIAAT